MKILHTVEFYPPSVGGMQEVVRQLSERLAKLGHDVTVATSYLPDRKEKNLNDVAIREFKISGNLAKGLSGEINTYQDYLRTSHFDIITNFAAQQWATDCAITILSGIPAKKVFVPTGFSGLYAPAYKDYFNNMKKWMPLYDMNVFLSNGYRDINFAREQGITRFKIIPNGAAAEEFLEPPSLEIRDLLSIPRDFRIILHVGSHTGLKGHRQAIDIFESSKIGKAALIIIGNEQPGGCAKKCRNRQRLFQLSPKRLFDRKRLFIKVFSRDQTVAAYQQADLFLFPSAIECSPLVLFECMASKTPFLTSSAGNAAEIIQWSKSGILLPTRKNRHGRDKIDVRASAQLLKQTLEDNDLLSQMKENGFSAWQQRFTWDKIAGDYEHLYQDLLRT